MTCQFLMQPYGAMVVVVPGSGTNSSGSVVENSMFRSSSESAQAETPKSNVAARVDTMSLRAVCVITTHYPTERVGNQPGDSIEHLFAMI